MFNGKEQDSETGLYYYGARYYDPRISVFYGVDPLTEKYLNISPYAYCILNPIRYTDSTGMWVPEVEYTTNSKGEKTEGHLIVRMEKEDNAKSLSEFLGINQERATKLYNSMNKDVIKLTDDIDGVSSINSAIKDVIDNASNYDPFFAILANENYNCWESAISISRNEEPDYKNVMSMDEFRYNILDDYIDVADDPEMFIFGHTVIRFAEPIWFSKSSRTTHGATYLGKSKDGTIYTWSKNGKYKSPNIFTLSEIIEKYGNVEGYRKEPRGGYYNIK